MSALTNAVTHCKNNVPSSHLARVAVYSGPPCLLPTRLGLTYVLINKCTTAGSVFSGVFKATVGWKHLKTNPTAVLNLIGYKSYEACENDVEAERSEVVINNLPENTCAQLKGAGEDNLYVKFSFFGED